MKTGSILMVHGTSTIAKIIQFFQRRRDKEAGRWNHSGIIVVTWYGTYVVEEAEVKGYKYRASVVKTPIEEYLESDRSLLVLEPNRDVSKGPEFMQILSLFYGIPYDKKNLLKHQPLRLLFGIWTGRKKKKAWKKMVCHEFTMTIWDEYCGIFPDRHKAKVSDIYRSPHFTHKPLKGAEKILRPKLDKLKSKQSVRVEILRRKRPVIID